MNSELKQAAQRALLALRNSQPRPSSPFIGLTDKDFIDHEETIRQLRNALQQPAGTLQACAQVQSEPIGEVGTMPGASGFTMACFRADEVPVGTKLYTTQQPATPEPTVPQEHEAYSRYLDAATPEPMTDDYVWHNDALMSANGTAGFKMNALMRIVRAVEAHHGITAQAKKETP